MDEIAFIRQPFRDGDRSGGIRILINGGDLVDLVRAIEDPFALREGSPSIAGAYSGLHPSEVNCSPSGHFTGNSASALYRYGQ